VRTPAFIPLATKAPVRGLESAEVAELGSEEVHALSGFQPDVTPSLYKIAWLSRHEPEAVARAVRLTGVHGYLVHALTGRWVDSVATADSLGLYDMASLSFSPRLTELAGLRADQLPDLCPAGSPTGEVTHDVLAAWGLPGPVTVVAGCGDGQAAGLGAGATRTDEAYLNLGTAVVAGVHSDTYRYGSVYRTDAAGLPGQYVLEVVQNSGAYLAGWFRSELGDPTLRGALDPGLEAAAEYQVCFWASGATGGSSDATGYVDQCYDAQPMSGTPTPVAVTAGATRSGVDASLAQDPARPPLPGAGGPPGH